jgi:histone H2B
MSTSAPSLASTCLDTTTPDAPSSARLDAHVQRVLGLGAASFIASLEASSGILAGAFVADALSGDTAAAAAAPAALSVDAWVPAEDGERVLASLDSAARRTTVETKAVPEREQVEERFYPHAEDREREELDERAATVRAETAIRRKSGTTANLAAGVEAAVANRTRVDQIFYKRRPASDRIGEWATAVHRFTADGTDAVVTVIALREGVDPAAAVASFDQSYAQVAARPETSGDGKSVEWLFAGPGVGDARKKRSAWSDAALAKLGGLPCAAASEWVHTLARAVTLAKRGVSVDFHAWRAAFTAWRSLRVTEAKPKGHAASRAALVARRAERAIAASRLSTSGKVGAAPSSRLWSAVELALAPRENDEEADDDDDDDESAGEDAGAADADAGAGGDDFADIPLVGFSASADVLDALDETVIDEAWDKWHREAVATDSLPFLYDDDAAGVPHEHPWAAAVHKVSRQIAPETKLSPEARAAVLARAEWLFNEVVDAAMVVEVPQRRATMSSRSIQTAVRLSLPGELAKHAVSEGTKAVTKFTSA